MDILEKFYKIRAWYAAYDETLRKKTGRPYYRTSHGLWGAAGMLDVFEFLMKAPAEKFTFADYGSGDGRIVLVAALFTKAKGVEGDKKLTAIARKAKKELLGELPELKRATFTTGNYYKEEHDKYNLIFFFPDHPFPEAFQQELKKSYKGYLLVYGNIHTPEKLKKGKTYWVQQVPLISYPINRPEEDLFAGWYKDDPALK